MMLAKTVARVLVLVAGGFATLPALAQSPNVVVVGEIADPSYGNYLQHIAVNFKCIGAPTCVGTYTGTYRVSDCSLTFPLYDSMTITGLNFGQSGTLQGTLTLSNIDLDLTYVNPQFPAERCRLLGAKNATGRLVGSWTGSSAASFQWPSLGTAVDFGAWVGKITVSPPQTPVFPIVVSGNVTPTVANVSVSMGFRPQDVGTQGSIYAFAVAPASKTNLAVTAMAAPKDAPVACVLAQINEFGQLQQIGAEGLAAYVSGVLTAQGQTVALLNGISTPNVAGATFFVGYGTNAQAMLNGGINRSVLTIPGTPTCQPQAPQTGWWWNPRESGRGYSIEASANKLFMAAFLYDASGRSTWYVSSGPTSLDGSLYAGDLESFSGGQTLGGSYRPPAQPPAKVGPLVLTFSDAQTGTITLPGGAPTAISRFPFGANGAATLPISGQPEGGWWWSPAESGRGYFIEWQGTAAYLAAYMYDDDGHPVWYSSSAQVPQPRSVSGVWQQFANGQTLAGPYRPPVIAAPQVGAATFQFQGADVGIMTLPGGRQVSISRFHF